MEKEKKIINIIENCNDIIILKSAKYVNNYIFTFLKI